MSSDEEEIPAWITEAEEAEPDLEEKLQQLWKMQAARRPDRALEARYEALRNEIQATLKETGPRYFLAADGEKYYAYRQAPESVQVDLDKLVDLYEDGKLPGVDLDKVAPRKLDSEEFRRVVSKGKVPKEIVADIANIVPKTPFVKFGQGDDA